MKQIGGFTFLPIGIIRSPFKEKFGIPRQPGIVPDARGVLEILPPFHQEAAFRGLSDFSHVWILFLFHGNPRAEWKPTVRPPRLGGDRRIGVFATRSGFRPNPIGMSAVELTEIRAGGGKLHLHLKGIDLLDGTPVLDLKPYLPYADCIPVAQGGFAPEPPRTDLAVTFSDEAEAVCLRKEREIPHLRSLLIQMLRMDPRPAYYARNPKKKVFGFRLYDFDVQWTFLDDGIRILNLKEPA
jgi:tRNA (adenine37-N6)-methyltransferase